MKGKCDNYAAEMIFQSKHLRAFNKCWTLQKRPPGVDVTSLVSTAQNTIGNCLWSMGCILLKIIIEGKPPSFKGG